MAKDYSRITPEEINGWLAPWPVSPQKKRTWEFRLVPLKTVLNWRNPNKLPNLGRISFKEVAARMKDKKLSGLQDHYIKVLSYDWVPTAKGLVVVMIEEDGVKIVFDGSHRLSALAYAQINKAPILMTHIGVLTPKKNEKLGKKGKKG